MCTWLVLCCAVRSVHLACAVLCCAQCALGFCCALCAQCALGLCCAVRKNKGLLQEKPMSLPQLERFPCHSSDVGSFSALNDQRQTHFLVSCRSHNCVLCTSLASQQHSMVANGNMPSTWHPPFHRNPLSRLFLPLSVAHAGPYSNRGLLPFFHLRPLHVRSNSSHPCTQRRVCNGRITHHCPRYSHTASWLRGKGKTARQYLC